MAALRCYTNVKKGKLLENSILFSHFPRSRNAFSLSLWLAAESALLTLLRVNIGKLLFRFTSNEAL